MNHTDHAGNPVGAASDDSLVGYAEALAQFHCYRGDPVATIDATKAAQPDFAMGHLLHAWLHVLGTEPEGTSVALADLERIEALRPNRREAAHAEAIRHFAAGRWQQAGRVLEDLSIEWPRDALALQAGHLVDYFRGDSRMLRDRIARALPAWSREDAGRHAIVAMHAFGCEETADYRRAEALGRSALELEPRDAWAQHAVAHVFEMEGRADDGIAWMREREPHWSEDNSLAVHNWWHLALFHLERDELDAVLALFDGPIHGARSKVTVDLIDASALLWRLGLAGVEVDERWRSVAQCWREVGRPGLYAFNDLHATMAWIGAGERAGAADWLAAQQALDAERIGDHAAIGEAVGGPLLRALQDFDRGRYAEAADTLRMLRPILHRFGGSHAQRDVVDLTLIEAALRSGRTALARALVDERLSLKPASAVNRRLQRRIPA